MKEEFNKRAQGLPPSPQVTTERRFVSNPAPSPSPSGAPPAPARTVQNVPKAAPDLPKPQQPPSPSQAWGKAAPPPQTPSQSDAWAKAAAKLQYESFNSAPMTVLNRDLNWLMRDGDPRYATPNPAELEKVTPAGFRAACNLSEGKEETPHERKKVQSSGG